ncbi:MAG TPA: hypothetical protein VKQ30_20685 [Ktedonobacterales bacterium]|nr:hypothetical protein [Ktedonobacterales bacterium]
MLPQLIELGLIFIDVYTHAAKHGKPYEGHYNARSAMISGTLLLLLLWWGGFWAPLAR